MAAAAHPPLPFAGFVLKKENKGGGGGGEGRKKEGKERLGTAGPKAQSPKCSECHKSKTRRLLLPPPPAPQEKSPKH